jgi:hypothetical protein
MLTALAAADDKSPQQRNILAPLERFVGGEWVTDGRWASGDPLRARGVYEWGVGKKFIRAYTYVQDGDREYQRYEGIMGWHPKKRSLFEISFAFDGAVSEYMIESKDANTLLIGFTPYGEDQDNKVRQTIKFTHRDTFVWTVSLKADAGWHQIIESTWHRKPK